MCKTEDLLGEQIEFAAWFDKEFPVLDGNVRYFMRLAWMERAKRSWTVDQTLPGKEVRNGEKPGI